MASISKKGTIKAKKAGKTTITATTSGKKLKCYVVVNESSSTEKNVLIAYFTHTGTTKEIAKKLQKLTGGDLLRIKERNKYTSDYDTLVDLAQDEIEQNARPKVTTEARNIDSYDVIYVGYPIWWHTAPMVVETFLERYDFTEKTIYPVSQSASMDRSQYNQSVTFIKDCARNATVDDGLFTTSTEQIHAYLADTVLK